MKEASPGLDISFGLSCPLFAQHFTQSFSDVNALTANESALVNGFSKKRIGDFSTGRSCARQALTRLGVAEAEILTGPRKEPLWPAGIVGSISHSKKLAGAVVARSTSLRAIGLDIEETGRVKPEMWNAVFSASEQGFLNSLPAVEQVFHTTLFFSMKESFYKLQYPLTNQFLWFNDVEIGQEDGKFRMQVKKEFDNKTLLPEFTNMHFTRFQDLVMTLCFLE